MPPGHKSVGARVLPPWIAALIVIPVGVLFVPDTVAWRGSHDFIPLAFIGLLALVLAVGCWHAWHQVK